MSTVHHFEELELIAEKAGELNDRVGKIENELGAQTKTLESAALVLDAAIKGLGALKSSVLENSLASVQLELNDKTAHLAREVTRFEAAVAEIDRRAEAGDTEIRAALLETAKAIRTQFDAKAAELAEWSGKVEAELQAHSVALAAIPPVIKGADAASFNPLGEWESGKSYNRLDLVSYAGSSYVSAVDGNTDKPGKSDKWTTIAKRAGSIAMGGVGDFGGLTGVTRPNQIAAGVGAWVVGDLLYANTTSTLARVAAGASGKLLATQGAGAAPIWVAATGGAGDVNGPAAATDTGIPVFDGTGGKTIKDSGVTIDGSNNVTVPGNLTVSGTGASSIAGVTTIGSARPVVANGALGFTSVKGDAGGWAIGTKFIGSGGTVLGGIWGVGTADALTSIVIGAGDFSTPLITQTATTTTVAGSLVTAAPTTGTAGA